ncbi:hypothetical protein [uncultured Hyphomicrobium sp.]|uniref:hypothetical protein n=1 Tax=uncultured Hyphomicrobium sp. TaxID=194373 RepID=UPI0025F759DA|nr:hypothetical protein [uncultured Hyphomicrobium sp.]
MGRTQDLGARGPNSVVTAGPWNGRDSYIAETAVTLDRLTAKIERLEQREEALKARVAELIEHAQQASRLQALAESLRNSRDYKLDEIIRQVKDTRGRLDAIEGPRSEYAALTYRSFIAVDRKLAEISASLTRSARFAGWLQASGVVIGLVAVTAGALFAGRVF